MNKVELEAKVDALMDEINFLRAFYEAVRDAGALAGGLEAGTTLTPPPYPRQTTAVSLLTSFLSTPLPTCGL